MVRAGVDYLAAADATAMAAQEQARCLRGLEQVNSVATAARASILAAFTAGQGHAADADYSPRAWLIHKTGVTRGAAAAYTAWVKRAAAHPQVAAALAAGEISESVARTLCLWTDKLREDRREEADKILADAAVSGLGLADLAGLFGEMYERSRAEEPDRDKEESFEDRALRLVTTLGGAGDHVPADTPGRRRRSSRPSSARLSTSYRVPAASPASCAAASWARSWAVPACRWTSAMPRPSRPASATRSSCAISAAGGPAAATSPRQHAKSTTSSTRPTAARPAPKNASFCVSITTRS